MNTPDSPTPPPSDSGVPASTPPPAAASAPKPAFKVTRSPFAPKLGGASGPAPISISATAGLSSVPTSSGPTAARAPRAAPQQARAVASSSKPSMAGLVVDIIAAGIAIAFAVLIALNYFSA
jgi:hypothetical protein